MKLNYKLINILILLVTIGVFIFIWPYFGGFFHTLLMGLLPLILAFTLAYILNPVINGMQKLKIPRILGIFIVYAVTILFIWYLIYGVVRPALAQLGDLSLGINNILIEIGDILNVDSTNLAQYINELVSNVTSDLSNYFTATGGTIDLVWTTIVGGAVIIVVGIIFLFNFPKMRVQIKERLKLKSSPKTYEYIRTLDQELTNYLWAEVIIAFIQFVEYAGLMLIISIFFPEFYGYIILVGVVAAILSLIPYFGGYFSILFTAIIIMTVPHAAYGMIGLAVFTLIFPQMDAYVINPKIYHTQIKLHPISTIAFVLVGQAFFGIIGAILSVPVQVIWYVTYKFYKEDMKKIIKRFNQSL